MVGRSSATNHLVGLIDAADVMTGDQPNVALVSGEAGIGKTRLVREVLAALPADVTAIGVSAQPGSMSRPLDAVAALVPAGVAGEEQADAVLASISAAVQRGPTILVIEDLHWIDAASANLIDRIAQQPWPNLVLVATYRPTDLVRGQPGGELVLRLERRHSVEQIRLERLCRIRCQRDGRGDLGGHPPGAVVGDGRGAVPAQQRCAVRRRGAAAGGRTAGDRVRPPRSRPPVVAGGGRPPAGGGAGARPSATRRSPRRLRPVGVVRRAAHRHRGRRGRTARRPPGAGGRRGRHRDERRPVLVLARPRRRGDRRSAARSGTSEVARAVLRGGAHGVGARPHLAGPPRPGRRPPRRGAGDRPQGRRRATCSRGSRSPRCALPPRGSARRRTTRSCWPWPPRRHGGWTSRTRRSTRRRGGVGSPSRWPTASRRPGSSPGCTTSSATIDGVGRRRWASWSSSRASLDDVATAGRWRRQPSPRCT